MSEEIWFLGRVSRQKAEEILHTAGINGSFVVRSSESISGAYALSVLFNKSIHTYRILPTEHRMLAVQTMKGVQQRKFSTLNDLVREYRSPQNGLICGLTNPVGSSPSKTAKPFSSAARKEPLPALPPTSGISAASNKSLPQSMGVKVMPNISSQINTITSEPIAGKVRNAPPVPNREASLRSLAISNSVKTSNAGQGGSEVKDTLLSRLNEIKAIWPAESADFFDVIRTYASDDGLNKDLVNVRNGCGQCAELQALLAREAVAFQSELENFLMKIDILRQLFDFNSPPRRTLAYNRMLDTDVDLDTFLGRLGDCQTVVKSLNMRVCINLQELLGVTGTAVVKSWQKKKHKPVEPVVEKTFEVKLDSALKFTKQKLKLDMLKGTLAIIKGDDTTEFDHSKVLQLIKNKKSMNKLSIVFDGMKKRDYTFDRSQQREAFCQLMQHIRNKHTASTEPDCVSVFCGSWNMGDAMPPNDISSWFLCNGLGQSLDRSLQTIPHDVYVVGTQETGMPEKDWMHKVQDTIQDITGTSFHLVVMDALWHIKIMVFVKEEHKNRISHVQTSSVKTGIANALGNKGAVAVSFQFGGTSFCFINAHLTSGSEKCSRRNQNYHDIIRSLNLGEDSFRIFDLTNRFDHLYFFGDLNYRLDMEVHDILSLIKVKDMNSLLAVDQLKKEMKAKNAFSGFDEEELTFPPTYRYERGTRESYAYLKAKKTGVRINVPSWCDRVLWRSYPETHNVCHAYGCSEDIMTSDHSPLFSNFQVGVRGQYVSKDEITASNTLAPSSINFVIIHVILKTTTKSNYYLQVNSVCLTGSVKSGRGTKIPGSEPGGVCLMWKSDNTPVLKPIISDREYLVDQHLLVGVCSEEDNEVIGECVIALRSKIGNSPHQFKENLTRKREDVGVMEGELLVVARDSQVGPKEKTYDFIRRDDDDVSGRRDMIEEVSYSDIDVKPPNSLRTTAQRTQMMDTTKQFHPEAKRFSDTIADAEYANPDRPDLNPTSVGSMHPSSPRRFSPVRTPPVPPSSEENRAPYKPQFTEKPGIRGYPNRRGNNLSPLSSPGVNPLSGPPLQGYSSKPATKHNLSDEMQLDEALAEFNKMELLLADSFKTFTPNTPATASADPSMRASSPSVIYQSPSSLPVATTSGETPNHKSQNQFETTNRFNAELQLANPRRATGGAIPSSVDEFLKNLRLEQYTAPLLDNGWDNIEFLGEITEDDLNDAGITNPQHCREILDYIHSLPV